MYFDAHTHLQQAQILPLVMKRAFNSGVRYFLCNATNEQDWDKVIDISKQYKGVYVALGVHPWYIDTLSKDWNKRLEQKLVENKNILIGEIGIDKLKQDIISWKATHLYQYYQILYKYHIFYKRFLKHLNHNHK